MNEFLISLESQQVKQNLVPIKADFSYTQKVAEDLGQIVFGQDEACRILGRRVAMFESGLSDPQRPMGVEFFLGPTGTGKTQMSHALSQVLFKDPNSTQLKILDCAEFHGEHTVARLIGSPPGYVGYGDEALITPTFLKNRNIIVFDEIEKADPRLHQILLGIMEDGRLRTRQRYGHVTEEMELDFSKSVIIMTSNIGAEEMQRSREGKETLGFLKPSTLNQDLQSIGMEALRKSFKHMPEFLGRIDDVVIFNSLQPEHYSKIFYKFLDEINDDLKKKILNAPFLRATKEFKTFILDQLDYKYGARDMRRILTKHLLEDAADIIICHDMSNKPLVADYDEGVKFYTTEEPLEPLKEFNPEPTLPAIPEKKKKDPQAPWPIDHPPVEEMMEELEARGYII